MILSKKSDIGVTQTVLSKKNLANVDKMGRTRPQFNPSKDDKLLNQLFESGLSQTAPQEHLEGLLGTKDPSLHEAEIKPKRKRYSTHTEHSGDSFIARRSSVTRTVSVNSQPGLVSNIKRSKYTVNTKFNHQQSTDKLQSDVDTQQEPGNSPSKVIDPQSHEVTTRLVTAADAELAPSMSVTINNFNRFEVKTETEERQGNSYEVQEAQETGRQLSIAPN